MFRKKCYTETLVGVKSELSIFVMRGGKSLAMITAANGLLYVNYDIMPPLLFTNMKSYWEKYTEAWEYISDVAVIQAENRGSELERFEINTEDFFRGGSND